MNLRVCGTYQFIPCRCIQYLQITYMFFGNCRLSHGYTAATFFHIGKIFDFLIYLIFCMFNPDRSSCSCRPYSLYILCFCLSRGNSKYHRQGHNTKRNCTHKNSVSSPVPFSKFTRQHPKHLPILIRDKCLFLHSLSLHLILSVLNPDDPICHLSHFFLMCHHKHRLMKSLCTGFQQSDHFTAVCRIQISRRLICQYNCRFCH